MFSSNDLAALSLVDIESVDKRTLVDITKFHIDPNIPLADRMKQYMADIRNPYCFRVGQTPVKISFSPDGKTLDNAVKDYLISMKKR
ncbi:MAG: hypothetical protein LBD02_03675 [Christensenellaceae bacterium]|jgi:hypothetical protein|nr:hypothetical protein [Christensenellaceae bacterium]